MATPYEENFAQKAALRRQGSTPPDEPPGSNSVAQYATGAAGAIAPVGAGLRVAGAPFNAVADKLTSMGPPKVGPVQPMGAVQRAVGGAANIAAKPLAAVGSPLRTTGRALNTLSKRAGVAGLVLGTGEGALSAIEDANNGKMVDEAQSLGINSPVGAAAYAASGGLLNRIGNAVTGGLAGKLGGYIGDKLYTAVNGEYDPNAAPAASGGPKTPAPATTAPTGSTLAQGKNPAPEKGSPVVTTPALPDEPSPLINGGLPNETVRMMMSKGGAAPGAKFDLAAMERAAPGSVIVGTADPSLGNSRINTFVGRGPIDSTGASDPTRYESGSGDYQADMARASQLRQDILRMTRGSGPHFGNPLEDDSGAAEVNKRYDQLASKLSSMYSARGQGNLAKHLTQLEGQRQQALEALNQNAVTERGQNMNAAAQAADTAVRAQDMGLRAQQQASADAYRNAMLANTIHTGRAAAQRQQQEDLYKRESDAAKDVDGFISSSFVDPATNKPDAAKGEEFRNFVNTAPQNVMTQVGGVRSVQELYSLPPQQRREALTRLKNAFEDMKQTNEYQKGNVWGGRTSDTYNPVIGVHPVATIDDWLNNGVRTSDYLASNIKNLVGLGDPQMAVLANGAVVPRPMTYNSDGTLNTTRLANNTPASLRRDQQ